jgi:hypothetical protein
VRKSGTDYTDPLLQWDMKNGRSFVAVPAQDSCCLCEYAHLCFFRDGTTVHNDQTAYNTLSSKERNWCNALQYHFDSLFGFDAGYIAAGGITCTTARDGHVSH